MRKIAWITVLVLGIFSCQDEEDGLLRMVYEETGCANPWQMSGDQNDYVENIRSYLFEKQVFAFSIEVRNELPEGTGVCLACYCWTGRNIYITIPPEQREKAEEIGFKEVES